MMMMSKKVKALVSLLNITKEVENDSNGKQILSLIDNNENNGCGGILSNAKQINDHNQETILSLLKQQLQHNNSWMEHTDRRSHWDSTQNLRMIWLYPWPGG